MGERERREGGGTVLEMKVDNNFRLFQGLPDRVSPWDGGEREGDRTPRQGGTPGRVQTPSWVWTLRRGLSPECCQFGTGSDSQTDLDSETGPVSGMVSYSRTGSDPMTGGWISEWDRNQ